MLNKIVHLKIVKMVNLMLHIFYSKKIKVLEKGQIFDLGKPTLRK